MSAADLAVPLRQALLADSAVTGKLAAYNGSFPIFTRRPTPTDAPYPVVVVSPDVAITDQDGIDDFRPVQTRDIAVYGQNDTADHYRDVESIAYAVRELFHSNRLAISVPNWFVVMINAQGPIPAPTDDDQTVGRLVTLQIQLARLA